MTDDNPYLAPESPPGAELPPDEPMEDEEWEEGPAYEYPGFLTRTAAKSIDILCFGFALMLVLTVFSAIKDSITSADEREVLPDVEVFYEASPDVEVVDDSGPTESDWIDAEYNDPPGLSRMQLNIVVTTAFIIFASLSEWRSGQSIGKLLFGLQVVTDGPPALPSLGMALGRNVGIVVDGMFCGAFAFIVMRTNARQQRAGDIGAHTLVVRKRSIPGLPLSSSTMLAQGLLAGVVSIVAFATLLLVLDPTL